MNTLEWEAVLPFPAIRNTSSGSSDPSVIPKNRLVDRARSLGADFVAGAGALLNGSVDAVVYDAPIIQYYTLKEGRARMAGHPFRLENYGIAFPLGLPLRRSVDQALLKLMENGSYDSLLRKWLGSSEGSSRTGT